jgi:hypothetical protein
MPREISWDVWSHFLLFSFIGQKEAAVLPALQLWAASHACEHDRGLVIKPHVLFFR